MIELITGTPGAGKTTFAVALRLALEGMRFIQADGDRAWWDDESTGGEKIQRRLVCAGFRGLKLEHEKLPHKLTGERTEAKVVEQWNEMLDDDTPKHQRLPNTPPVDCPAIVQNWWLWCKPGDIICVDEAQFVAPRGTMGRKPPYWIQAMEIHRHYGVDFLIVTQHPQLIDTTIRALVGLHRHVRSVMGSPLCMVYVWDHASNPERFSLANKSMFVRRAKHYAMFHSSVAHVAPPSSGRSVLAVVPLLFLGLAVGVYSFAGKFSEDARIDRAGGKPGDAVAALPAPVPGGSRGVRVAKDVRGCWSQGDLCRCIDSDGGAVKLPRQICEMSAAGFDGAVKWAKSTSVRYEASDERQPATVASGASAPVKPLAGLKL